MFYFSDLLVKVADIFEKRPQSSNLFFDGFIKKAITENHMGLRSTVLKAIKSGIPAPAFSSVLALLDAFTTDRLPANLLRAQKDYMGAYGFELLEGKRKVIRYNWTKHTGKVLPLGDGKCYLDVICRRKFV